MNKPMVSLARPTAVPWLMIALMVVGSISATAGAQVLTGAPSPGDVPADLIAHPTAYATTDGAQLTVLFPHDVVADSIRVADPASPGGLTLRATGLVEHNASGIFVARRAYETGAAASGEELSEHVVRYAGVLPGVDEVFTAYQTMLKHEVEFRSQPEMASNAGWFGVETEVVLDAGLAFGPDPLPLLGESVVVQALHVADAAGEVAYGIGVVYAVDAMGDTVDGQLRFARTGEGRATVTMEVPVSWMRQAAYPVRIDPIVFTGRGPGGGGGSQDPFNISGVGPNDTVKIMVIETQASLTAANGATTPGGLLVAWAYGAFPAQGYALMDRVRITVGHTSRDSTSFSTTFATNFDQNDEEVVFDGRLLWAPDKITGSPTFPYPTVNFQEGYAYNGTDNLAIQIEIFDPPDFPVYMVNFKDGGLGFNHVWMYAYNATATAATRTFPAQTMRAAWFFSDFAIDTPDTLPPAYLGDPYSQSFAIVGTPTGSVTWAATGLPTGLNVNGATGQIMGTIGAADLGQTFAVAMTAQDAANNGHTRQYELEAYELPEVTPFNQLAPASVGVAVQVTPQATKGKLPYAWLVTGLPTNLQYDPATGEVSGTPLASDTGAYQLAFEVTDAGGKTDTELVELRVNPRPSFSAIVLPPVTELVRYVAVVPIEGGTGDFTYGATGLPDGLMIDTSTGVISGAVDLGASALSPVMIEITVEENADAFQVVAAFTLEIVTFPQLATTKLPPGFKNRPYGPALIEVSGGVAPYTIRATGLPMGLTFDDGANEILGTVDGSVNNGDHIVQFVVSDANGALNVTSLLLRIGATASAGSACATVASGTAVTLPFFVLIGLIALIGVRRSRMIG